MDEETEEKKPGKAKVMLKQYLVSGAPPGAKRVRKGALILQTCPKNANDEFRRKFPDCRIWSTSVAAESRLTKEDLEGRDFWAERLNWMLFDVDSDDAPLGGI